MSLHNEAHGTITLELRDRVMFATYSGVLDQEAFDNISPRLHTLFDRLNRHYWALVADVSNWNEPDPETLQRNAELLQACLDNGRPEKALPILERGLSLRPDDEDFKSKQAEAKRDLESKK